VRRLIALPLVLFAGLIFAIGLAVPASAHTSLVGIDPAEGSTVVAGDAVTLDFSEALLTIGAEATVTDSTGAVTKLDVSFPKPTSAQVVLPSVPGGSLTLAWRVVAGDGHPVEGTLAYVADAPMQGSPSSAPSSTASAGVAPSPAASATPILATPSAAPSTSTGGSSGPNLAAVALAFGAALLVTIVAIISAKRRR
jgi:hypothetical protein